MDISIICPIYNGSRYIERLHESLVNQKEINSFEIRYILTESSDNSKEILDKLSAKYTVVTKDEFSHSLTREKEAYKANGDIYYNNKKIGERYQLVVSNIQQTSNDGFKYSGIMTVAFQSGKVTDKSGNANDG